MNAQPAKSDSAAATEATAASAAVDEPSAAPPAAPAVSRAAGVGAAFGRRPAALGVLLALAAFAVALLALWLAWDGRARLQSLEAELVKRQQLSSEQAAEARIHARQAQEAARESVARLALLEVRVAESALQRTQMEELMQSVARSRDENVLADLDAALRVAMQQSAITGSADPLLTALKQAEDRLGRHNQPQLERVRRAVASDLERVKSVAVSDIASLTLRLDEAIRLVDELPLLARPLPRRAAAAMAAKPAASAASGAASAPAALPAWAEWALGWSRTVWDEARSLVRVTTIDQPEAMLVAPDQAYFLRENLKLRLLNARLALLSRQFDTAQSDLRDARAALDRYFDRGARPVVAAADLVRQVMAQARLVVVPRPDATLAAIAAASAGR